MSESVCDWILQRDALSVENGGARKGARFNHDSFAETLNLGNWTPGSVFEHKKIRYRVTNRCTVINKEGREFGFTTYHHKMVEIKPKPEPRPEPKPAPEPKPRAKARRLTKAEVEQVRRLYDGSRAQMKEIAARFGVSYSAIYYTIKGK